MTLTPFLNLTSIKEFNVFTVLTIQTLYIITLEHLIILNQNTNYDENNNNNNITVCTLIITLLNYVVYMLIKN